MNDTGKARLPGLVSPRLTDADLSRWVQAVSERLEVREGTRGNPYERALTVRDLVGTGLVRLGSGGGVIGSGAPGGGTPGIGAGDGNYEKLWDELKNSRLYKDLMMRIDDPDRFNDLAEEVKAVLLNDIAEEARRRGADVRRLDTKIQTDLRSLAMSVQEVTAAVDDASAGVRSTQFAQAEAGRAIAGQVTQVVARLDGDRVSPADLVAPVHATLDALRTAVPAGVAGKYYQVKNPVSSAPPILYRWDAARGKYVLAGMANSAAIEQVMRATADRVEGLSAEYFVKVQAGGVFGGFGVSAHEKDGVGYSQFLIAADRFAMVNPSGNLNPFAISQVNGVGPFYIYLNGQVRINATGNKAEDLANALGLSASGQVFNVDNKGAVTPADLTVTATLKGRLEGQPVTFTSVPALAGTKSGNTYKVPSSAFGTGATVTVTATASIDGLTYSDNFSLYKVLDGADALVGFLTNESHGVPASHLGVVSNYAGAGGEMVVFKGGQRLTSGVVYSVSANLNNLAVTISPSTGVYVVSGGLLVDSATVKFRAVVGAATIDKVFTLTRQQNGEDGGYTDYIFRRSTTQPSTPTSTGTARPTGWDDVPPQGFDPLFMSQAYRKSDDTLVGLWSTPVRMDGAPAVRIDITNDIHAIPCNLDGTNPNYTGAETTASVYVGSTDDSANWTWTISAAGVAAAVTNPRGNAIKITDITTDSGYVDITARKTGFSDQTARFSVYRAKGGAYWVIPAANAVKKLENGTLSPSTLSFDAKMMKADGTLTGYSGRFIVATSTDGTAWTEVMRSSVEDTLQNLPLCLVGVSLPWHPRCP